jgi:2-dehydropantoate 2-reductase
MSSSAKTIRSVAVLGAGAMGSFVGGCLATEDVEVTLLDINDLHIAAVRADGLKVVTDVRSFNVRPGAMRPAELREAPDLLIVLTKHGHTVEAMQAISDALSDKTWILTLQNGLGNQQLIERFVPRARVLLGVTTYPADFLGPGFVGSHGEGIVRLMNADGVRRPVADEIALLFNASGQICSVDENLHSAIWSKVAFNCAMNSMAGTTGCTVGQLGSIPEGRQLALDIAAEVVVVANRSGVSLDVADVHATVNDALDHHTSHRPSMLQDLLAGRDTEIASINGAVVDVADRLGQPVPCTRALFALIRLIELRQSAERTARQREE